MSDTYTYTFYMLHPKDIEPVQIYEKNIRDCYIGSTRRPAHRFTNHKYNCNNPDSNRYNLPVYRHIRESGGYDNWKFSLLETHNMTILDAKTHERSLIELYAARLNKQRPIISITEKYDYARSYRDSHKETACAYQMAYRAVHREERNQKQKAYRDAKKALSVNI